MCMATTVHWIPGIAAFITIDRIAVSVHTAHRVLLTDECIMRSKRKEKKLHSKKSRLEASETVRTFFGSLRDGTLILTQLQSLLVSTRLPSIKISGSCGELATTKIIIPPTEGINQRNYSSEITSKPWINNHTSDEILCSIFINLGEGL